MNVSPFTAGKLLSQPSAHWMAIVAVRYGGDSSQLSDIVRAMLEFKMSDCCTGMDILDKVDSACEEMLEMEEHRSVHVYLTHFDDRYQRPLKGYIDFLLLMVVNGFAFELQLNFDDVLKVKENVLRLGLMIRM